MDSPGSFQEGVLGVLFVKVDKAEDLLNVDQLSGLSDAYVELQFDGKSVKTAVVDNALNPVFNE